MMFKLSMHQITGHRVVEVWDNGAFIACIYPGASEMRIVSKHPMTVEHDNAAEPAAISIKIGAT